ncbi:MAG: serine--tRNA ligase, partial [Geminicoccaceae bacterium]
LELDAARRELETRLQEDQATRNRLSREIGQRSAKGERPTPELLAEMTALKERIREGEDGLRELAARLDALVPTFPNVLADEVPDGPDESHNVELRRWGSPRSFAFTPMPHEELGAGLGMDFGRGARLSGARFVVLWDQLAALERALGQFMLALQTEEHGYTEVAVPYLVRDEAVFGTGQLPKFADDLFRTNSGHWLIPTSEVPLTNLAAGEILDEAKLPLRVTALTPCFRLEAGAAGKDTKGMIRQHQFSKVELVGITTPEQSEAEQERMVGCAEAVLQRLELPYRVIALAAGDTGFGARRTLDLEVWLPGQGAYREISSCSNCGDFQARRMNARCRARDAKQTRFVHTLNGSGLAVGRTLIAVLENYQEADGSITVPAALRPFMRGRDRLTPGER